MSATADATPATGKVPPTAWIDESQCIGCTLCIQACPFDAIVGATRRMHTVVESLCTGCELCLPPCPVDCIAMIAGSPARTWGRDDAKAAGQRVKARKARLEGERAALESRLASRAHDDEDPVDQEVGAPGGGPIDRIAAIVARAVQRARQRRSGTPR